MSIKVLKSLAAFALGAAVFAQPALAQDKPLKVGVTAGPHAQIFDVVKAEAAKRGIAVDDREFHCKGEFKGIHKGRPNSEDLAAAAEFAKTFI